MFDSVQRQPGARGLQFLDPALILQHPIRVIPQHGIAVLVVLEIPLRVFQAAETALKVWTHLLGGFRDAQVLKLPVIGFDGGVEPACRGALQPCSLVAGASHAVVANLPVAVAKQGKRLALGVVGIVFGQGSVPYSLDEGDFRRSLHRAGRLAGNRLILAFMVVTVDGDKGRLLAGSLEGLGDQVVMQGLEHGELDHSLKIAPRMPVLGLVEHLLPVDGGPGSCLLLFDRFRQTLSVLLVFVARSFLNAPVDSLVYRVVSHGTSVTPARIGVRRSSGSAAAPAARTGGPAPRTAREPCRRTCSLRTRTDTAGAACRTGRSRNRRNRVPGPRRSPSGGGNGRAARASERQREWRARPSP